MGSRINKRRAKKRANRKKAILAFLFLLFSIASVIFFTARLTKTEFYIKDGDAVNPSCNYSFLNRFLKKDDLKKGKTEYEATIFFKKLPYTVTTLDFDETPVLCRIGESISLETKNLTGDPDIKTPGGKLEEEKVTYGNAGNYVIDVNDHGVTFQKKVTVVDDSTIYLKVGDSYTLPVEGEWSAQDEKMELTDGQAVAAVDGKTGLIIHLGDNEISVPVEVVNLLSVISLDPGEKYSLPGTDGQWTCDIKAKKGKVSSKKCGVYPYTYSYHGLEFSGKVYVTKFPDKLGLRLGAEQKVDLEGVEGEKFTSSDKDVAEISKDGTITAKKEGTCDITAKTDEIEKTCHLMIKDLPESYLGDDRHNDELELPDDMEAKVKDEEIATAEDGKLYLHRGGETEVTLTKDGYEFTIPVYVSYFENGNTKGYATKYQSDGTKNTFTVFCQHSHSYRKYNRFLTNNGCSLCSLSCVLSGYTDYQDPVDVMDHVEKSVVGSGTWNSHHHHGKDGKAMPMTLYGVNRCLNSQGIETDYVARFSRSEMKEDIWNALSEGNVVVIEVSKTNQVTGKTDRYWSNSVHTVVLLGCYGEDGVYVGDPANYRHGSGSGRIKETTLSRISQYMWSCSTSSPHSFYWNGKGQGGGYIKVLGMSE